QDQEKQKQKQFEEWKCKISSISSIATIFSTIKSLVKYYLKLNISLFLIEQIKKSMYYVAICSTIEKVKLITDYKSLHSKNINNKPN
ncbi:25305_t:CDS:1, partial [Racocetra persica]